MKKLNLLIAMLIMAAVAVGQSVGINSDGSAPHASAMLDVKSSDKGFLPPRVYDPAGSISSPAGGLLVYKDDGTADNPAGFYYYNGAAWTRLDDVWTKNAAGINYSGNVGIGTTVPYSRLSLGNSPANISQRIALYEESNGHFFYGIGLCVPTSSASGIGLFGGTEDSAPTDDSPHMFIQRNTGNVGIGTTSPAAPLHVGTSVDNFTAHGSSGVRYFNYGLDLTQYTSGYGTLNGVAIFAQGDVVSTSSFVAASDKRIKTDIKELNNSIDVIKKLKPVQYTKIDKIQNGNKLHYGFIAQEVEEVIPNAVNTSIGEVPVLKPFEYVSFEDGVEYTILVKNGDDIVEQKYTTKDLRPEGEIIVKSKTVDDFKSLSYDMIFTVAVDAIREQQAQIEAQQGQLEAQQAQLASQQAQIDALKAQNAVLTQKAEAYDQLKAEVENLKKLVNKNIIQLSINQ